MNAAQSKSVDYMLTAHGFDLHEWELVTCKNAKWNVYSKAPEGGHDISELYSSKITVKPLVGRFDIEEILAAVSRVKPVKVARGKGIGGGLLEVPLFDMHWGVSDLDYYTPTMGRIVGLIRERPRDEILLAVGSDLFHNDNFKNQTANGTIIDTMDFPSAWADATEFYSTLIEEALRKATVHLVYVKGNHDESMSWAFCQMLSAMYPQVVCDLAIEERKLHTYGDICIGFTHGDKAMKDIDRVFMSEPQFCSASIREIHTGHLHHESSKDQYGVMVRVLATKNRIDQWSRDNGYVGTCRRFSVFDYSPAALESITYV